jgi:hypothetical protein
MYISILFSLNNTKIIIFNNMHDYQTILLPKSSQSFYQVKQTCQVTSCKTLNKKKEIPRRRKPILQWQGHHASELQAELEGQGRQKFDNQ